MTEARKIPGVISVRAEFETQTLFVRYDRRVITEAKVAAAVNEIASNLDH
ncbi:MAG TPA: hypothetical protein VMJ92_02595 [Candidatus Limnocylindrales bacterium]|nr:hypothetical protein [Candidatus Limnocylindrales bacterium]